MSKNKECKKKDKKGKEEQKHHCEVPPKPAEEVPVIKSHPVPIGGTSVLIALVLGYVSLVFKRNSKK